MIILGIGLGIVVAALAFALSRWITVTGEIGPERREFRIRYLGFTFRPSHTKRTKVNVATTSDRPDEAAEREAARSKRTDARALDRLKLIPESLLALKSALSYLVKRLRIDELRVSGTVGTDDPAETGTLIGAIYAVYGALQPWSRNVELSIRPDFEAGDSAVQARGRVSVRLGTVIGLFVVLLWHLPKRRIWRTWRAQRWGRRHLRASRHARGTEVGI